MQSSVCIGASFGPVHAARLVTGFTIACEERRESVREREREWWRRIENCSFFGWLEGKQDFSGCRQGIGVVDLVKVKRRSDVGRMLSGGIGGNVLFGELW